MNRSAHPAVPWRPLCRFGHFQKTLGARCACCTPPPRQASSSPSTACLTAVRRAHPSTSRSSQLAERTSELQRSVEECASLRAAAADASTALQESRHALAAAQAASADSSAALQGRISEALATLHSREVQGAAQPLPCNAECPPQLPAIKPLLFAPALLAAPEASAATIPTVRCNDSYCPLRRSPLPAAAICPPERPVLHRPTRSSTALPLSSTG